MKFSFFKIWSAGLLIVATLVFLSPLNVSAQINFGGMVFSWVPICQTPIGVFLTIGPPTPMPLMYLVGSSFYYQGNTPTLEGGGSFSGGYFLYGPPSHPGQWILGRAGMGWVPCIIWVPCGFAMCPIVIGGGFPILYNGSSL